MIEQIFKCNTCSLTTSDRTRLLGWIHFNISDVIIRISNEFWPERPGFKSIADGGFDFCCKSCLKKWIDEKFNIDEK